jgi:clan AA aspartic protease
MIIGSVNERREAGINFEIRDSNGVIHAIDAVIDTGFNGSLTLPVSLISSLSLVWHGREQGVLADGSIGLFDIYADRILWGQRERVVIVAAAGGTPLAGTKMLEGHEMCIQFVDGGEVKISEMGPRE